MANKANDKKRRDWRPRFLERLAKSLSVTDACKAARIGRTAAYQARKDDAEFAAAWEAAIEQAVESAEGEMYRRAVDGTRKPVYQSGSLVGHVQEYSDTLLIFMLKAHRPDKYRERVENWNINLAQLSDEQLERIAKGEHPGSVVASAGSGGTGAPPAAAPDQPEH